MGIMNITAIRLQEARVATQRMGITCAGYNHEIYDNVSVVADLVRSFAWNVFKS